MSEPSYGMKTSTMAFTAMTFLAFVAAGLVWLLAMRNARMAEPVFEQPIYFEKGFSFTDTFTVAFPGVYRVEAVCPRTDLSSSSLDGVFKAISKQLPVAFTIECDGKLVAEGDSPIRGCRCSAKEDARRMAAFRGEAGKKYQLSFRCNGAVPALDVAQPTLRIRLSQGTTIGGLLLHLCTPSLACAIAVGGSILALSPCSFWVWRVFRREPKAA